jgi:two-component system sensor histidine kinase ComP
LFFTIGCIFASLGPSIRGDAVGKLVIFSAIMMLPVVFLHFLKSFFEERGSVEIRIKSLAVQYAIVALAAAGQLCYFFDSIAYYVFRFSLYFTLIYYVAGVALILFYLIAIYIKYRHHHQLKLIVKTILISIVISFSPLVLFSFIPKLLFRHEWIGSIYTAWFVLFFPISFAYLILSKQLFDIDIVLRRVLFTITISLVPSTLLSLVFAIQAEHYLEKIGIHFLITLAVMSLVLYSLEYLTTKLEKIMFPRKHFLQASLKKIAKNLSSVTTFRQMKEIILSDIVGTMQVYGGAIVFELPDSIEVISEGAISAEEIERLLREQKLRNHPDYHTFEINRHEEYTSYFVMTRKKTNAMLGREEIQWLNLILSYLSVSLENVYLIRKLNMKTHEIAAQLTNEQEWQDLVWLRKSMFQLQERERVRIANDLHDTTMQDIFFVMRKVKSLFKISQNGEAQKQLTDVITHLELINMNLRQCCFELNPHLIQNIGLSGALQNFVDAEQGLSPFELNYAFEGTGSLERLDLETKRHIFRIVQELITNAKKHAGASAVSVKLSASGGSLLIQYEDDGSGFDQNAGAARGLLTSSGLGLEQMRTRILHLGGRLEMQSAPGEGVKATILIPILKGVSA